MITEEMEQADFELIANAGGAKSCYLNAVQLAKQGKFDEAEASIAEGDELYVKGHDVHGKILALSAQGNLEVHLLLVHAEDQMMSCEMFKNMAVELIDVYKAMKG